MQLARPLADLDQAWRAAGLLAQSRLLPAALYTGNPAQVQANVALILWYGAELGLPPMQALQSIYVVKGKPQMSGQLWMAKVREAGHTLFVACRHCGQPPAKHPITIDGKRHAYEKDHDESRCTVTIERGDTGERHSETFTIQDAVRAGLCQLRDGQAYARSSKGEVLPWEAWTKRMLQWRATSTCATTICPEVALGYGMEGDEIATDEPSAAESLAQAVDARTEQPPAAEPGEDDDVHDADIVTEPTPDEQAVQEAADEAARQEVLAMEAEHTAEAEPDPLHYDDDEIREGS